MKNYVQNIDFVLDSESLRSIILAPSQRVGGLWLSLSIDEEGKVFIVVEAAFRQGRKIETGAISMEAVPTPPGRTGKEVDLDTLTSEQRNVFEALFPQDSKLFSEG